MPLQRGIIQRYLGKISGPLLDRIDLHIEVPAAVHKELLGTEMGATSAEMRERVLAARAIHLARGSINANTSPARLREICPLDAAAEKTLEMALRRLALSARAHDWILKVSRTIAGLGGSEQDPVDQMGQTHRRSGSMSVARPGVLEVKRTDSGLRSHRSHAVSWSQAMAVPTATLPKG